MTWIVLGFGRYCGDSYLHRRRFGRKVRSQVKDCEFPELKQQDGYFELLQLEFHASIFGL
jgi:hypothetical protein